jgi:phenol 2-monooxygenase
LAGLITAYQLARNLAQTTHKIKIIEKYPKSSQDQHGRAITLFPRSSEMLDQLGLADQLAQQCFACRQTVNYDKDGKETMGRGWSFMDEMKDSKWDFALVLRQKYQEEIYRRALAKHGVELDAPCALTSVEVLDNAEPGDYKILATTENGVTKAKSVIKCRYLIGADGGKSFVRRAMGVPFDGSSSEDKWVRVDGVIETDLPKPRSYCAIESPTHGNVLWAALDHGATRIGYAFTAERQKAYEVFDEKAAVKEAIASVKPFSLEFKTVDWWTIYVVGQRIARSFFVKDCIFLVGDACHTHSSGAAQGLNTGIHDAVNLGWKLSLVLQDLANQDLLHTYEAERLPNVHRLIKYDKDISRLMTMQLPENWTGDPNADPNDILGHVMKEASTFSSGLGIYYEPDTYLNIGQGSTVSSVQAGQRAPDVPLQKPATFESTRLQAQTPNTATFYIVLFAGDVARTKSSLATFTNAMSEMSWLVDGHLPIENMSIIGGPGEPSAFETLDGMPFGKVFYDKDCSAHQRYGIDIEKGAAFVLRPDGWVGMVVEMNGEAGGKMESYFSRFIVGVGATPGAREGL